MSLNEEERKRFQQALARLNAVRSALTVYKSDHNGAFPKKLADLVPKYLSSIPELNLPGHKETAVVINTGQEIARGQEELNNDDGGWKYFSAPGSPDYGKVALNCTHEIRHKKLCDY